MPLSVATLDDFAKYLGRSSADQLPDSEVAERQLIAAEQYVQGKIPYELAAVDEERPLFVDGESVARLPGGLRSATAIVVDGRELSPGQYRLIGRHGYPYHLMFGIPWGACAVTITGSWGFAEPPESLLNAIFALAARDHFQKLNKQADVTQSADGSASSYYDRIPTVTSLAINNLQIPSL